MRGLTWGWTLALAFLASLHWADGFKALFLFPFPGKSHFGTLSVLAEELARRGHDVTVLSHFPKEKAPYKEIIMDPKPFNAAWNQPGMNVTEFGTANPIVLRTFMWKKFGEVAELVFSSKVFQDLAASNEHYDVVLGEVSFLEPFLLVFGHKFGAPVVDLCPAAPFTHFTSYMGNPFSFSYIPDPLLPSNAEMSFMERLENAVNGVWDLLLFNWYFLPSQERLMREHLTHPWAANMPSLSDMAKNISLSLVNSHFSIGHPRPYAPNMVEVAGMHLKPVQKLPKDLQEFMDGAQNGVVYVSFGSVIKMALLGEYRARVIADALKRLKQRVVIKLDAFEELFQGIKNIRTLSWAPQQEILAHPKLVLFVTHGGYNSLIEATRAGVPVLGIPVFADQFRNIRFYESRGIGRGLHLAFTSDQLHESILTIIKTPSENAKEISRRTQDRPLGALDTAVFWVEYVVRHKGAAHLRPASVYLPLHQYLLLDIIGAVFLIVLIVYELISRLCCSRSKSNPTKKESSKKKNN